MAKDLGGTSSFGLGRLLNLNKSAEGTNLLPPQVGEFRIPFVNTLTLQRVEVIDGQNYFTLSWQNVDLPNVSNYRVYVNDAGSPSNAPIGPYIAPQSPVRIAVIAPTNTRLIFRLQTVLNNGFQSNLDAAPTCTGITLA